MRASKKTTVTLQRRRNKEENTDSRQKHKKQITMSAFRKIREIVDFPQSIVLTSVAAFSSTTLNHTHGQCLSILLSFWINWMPKSEDSQVVTGFS